MTRIHFLSEKKIGLNEYSLSQITSNILLHKMDIFESQERILYEFIGLNILTRTLNFCDVNMLCGTYSKLILLIVISAKYI